MQNNGYGPKPVKLTYVQIRMNRIEKANDQVVCMDAIQYFLIYMTETIRFIKDLQMFSDQS